MNNPSPYKLKKLLRKHIRSYKYAFRGLVSIFLQQLNFRIELFISIGVIVSGIFFNITKIEWLIIIFVIGMVLISEALNSSIEAICDAVTLEQNEHIKYAKDVASGAVLLAAFVSILVGIIIFGPYLKEELGL